MSTPPEGAHHFVRGRARGSAASLPFKLGARVMNRLTTQERTPLVAALVDGESIRSLVRMTGIATNTIVKLLAERGHRVCEY